MRPAIGVVASRRPGFQPGDGAPDEHLGGTRFQTIVRGPLAQFRDVLQQAGLRAGEHGHRGHLFLVGDGEMAAEEIEELHRTGLCRDHRGHAGPTRRRRQGNRADNRKPFFVRAVDCVPQSREIGAGEGTNDQLIRAENDPVQGLGELVETHGDDDGGAVAATSAFDAATITA